MSYLVLSQYGEESLINTGVQIPIGSSQEKETAKYFVNYVIERIKFDKSYDNLGGLSYVQYKLYDCHMQHMK